MQNYRPFKGINPELWGAKLKSKDGTSLTMITTIDISDIDNAYLTGERWHNNESLFEKFVFADTGLPVGEEVKEELKLIKDKPYIVKDTLNMHLIRYYSHESKDGTKYFFTYGQNSLTSIGEFSIYDVICEYTPELWEQYKNN